jgi:hypothetical protein
MIENFMMANSLFIIFLALCWILGFIIFLRDDVLGNRTWYFSYTRILIIISFIILLIFLFYISYKQLGKTVHLSDNYIKLYNIYKDYILIMKFNMISLILLHLDGLIILMIYLEIIGLYFKLVRVSFTSWYYYLRYYIMERRYKYGLIEDIFYYLNNFLSRKSRYIYEMFEDACYPYKLRECKIIYFIYKMFFSRLRFNLYMQILTRAPIYLVIIYYIYLMYTTGEIVLEKYYYFVIFSPLYRTIMNILEFLMIDYLYSMSSYAISINVYNFKYEYEKNQSINTNIFKDWYSKIRNFKDLDGLTLRNTIEGILFEIPRPFKTEEEALEFIRSELEKEYNTKMKNRSKLIIWFEWLEDKITYIFRMPIFI